MSPRTLSDDALKAALRDAFEALHAANGRDLPAVNLTVLTSRRDVLLAEAKRRGMKVALHPPPTCVEPWWASYTPEYDDPIRAALDAYKAALHIGADPDELDRLCAELRRAQAVKLAVIYPSGPSSASPIPLGPAPPWFRRPEGG
ncbi:hypothetical protein [Roseomonas populi]|uniref:Uncharacterized protein n=1 Tax=Roseomonas populi TaxID=3121582 RepID=A0ABT1XB24_9PROT|nr:hypothetical protein [Roseomonas pecuniae]MCR0985315.1 hypothetical protein [Roseomonas pecuniae]